MSQPNKKDLDFLLIPGGELISTGLADLKANQNTEAALLVLIAGERLRRLGFEIEEKIELKPYEMTLYFMLEDQKEIDAYSLYNSYLRRITSFAQTLETNSSD